MWSIINIKNRLFQSFLHLFKATFWCWYMYFTSKSATEIEFNIYSFTCQHSWKQPVLTLVHKISFKSSFRYRKRIHSWMNKDGWVKLESFRKNGKYKWLTLESIMAEKIDTHFLFLSNFCTYLFSTHSTK